MLAHVVDGEPVIGIRMLLGANRRRIIGMVLAGAFRQVSVRAGYRYSSRDGGRKTDDGSAIRCAAVGIRL